MSPRKVRYNFEAERQLCTINFIEFWVWWSEALTERVVRNIINQTFLCHFFKKQFELLLKGEAFWERFLSKLLFNFLTQVKVSTNNKWIILRFLRNILVFRNFHFLSISCLLSYENDLIFFCIFGTFGPSRRQGSHRMFFQGWEIPFPNQRKVYPYDLFLHRFFSTSWLSWSIIFMIMFKKWHSEHKTHNYLL